MSIAGLSTVDVIKAIRYKLFEKEFDIEVFTEYIYEHFSKNSRLIIGIGYDKTFEKFKHKAAQTYKPKRFCKWISYPKNARFVGTLNSNVQIPQRFEIEVENFLRENGFDKIEKRFSSISGECLGFIVTL